LKIETNGDFEPEIAFHVLFAFHGIGQQTATVYRATGADACESGAVGEVIIHQAPVSFGREAHITSEDPYRFYAGFRSDPFHADRMGFANNMQWTRNDYFADKNIFGIALEVPNHTLGTGSQLGIWARTIVSVHGSPRVANLVGLPGNNVIMGPVLRDTPPAQQRDLFLQQSIERFQSFGYGEAEAAALAMDWLPDVLRYDYTNPAGWPNGRQLTDDVVDRFLILMTQGRMITDFVEPHTDFLAEFPYLGPPHGS
jgi:hypothetical protein